MWRALFSVGLRRPGKGGNWFESVTIYYGDLVIRAQSPITIWNEYFVSNGRLIHHHRANSNQRRFEVYYWNLEKRLLSDIHKIKVMKWRRDRSEREQKLNYM
jgi:hypothetical protein